MYYLRAQPYGSMLKTGAVHGLVTVTYCTDPADDSVRDFTDGAMTFENGPDLQSRVR